MNYYDLHCPASLQSKAKELGWKAALQPTVLAARRFADLEHESRSLVFAESESLDLLLHSLKRDSINAVYALGFRDWYKDNSLVQTAADNSKPFEIRISDFLHAQGYSRSRLIIKTRQFLRKCVKRRAPFIITSAAQSSYDLKSPFDAMAIGVLFGLTLEQAQYAISKQAERVLQNTGLQP